MPKILHQFSQSAKTYRIVYVCSDLHAQKDHDAFVIEYESGKDAMGVRRWLEVCRISCRPTTDDQEPLLTTIIRELCAFMVEKGGGDVPRP